MSDTNETSQRKVSPVVGVILMVTITVILAVVLGTFILNQSSQEIYSSGPQVGFMFDYDSTTKTAEITYLGTSEYYTDVTLFSDSILVSVSSSTSEWNGETVRGVVEPGSTHRIQNIDSGLKITITAYENDYAKPSIIEFTSRA